MLPARRRPTSTASRASSATSGGEIYFTFVLALLFIYLVLSAQFESFVDPFVIMLSVPLSMTGALLALWLTGGTLNIYSQIGLVTLVGPDHQARHPDRRVLQPAAGARARRCSTRSIDAATLRLRPILMTTGAMVLGARAAGARHRRRRRERASQIGWVIVGGMTFGTLLTLFVVPTAYTLLAGARAERVPKGDGAGGAR